MSYCIDVDTIINNQYHAQSMELNDATNIEVGSCIRDTTLYRIMEKKKLECFNDLADVNLIIDDYKAWTGNQLQIQKSQKDAFRVYRCCEHVKCTFQVRFSMHKAQWSATFQSVC